VGVWRKLKRMGANLRGSAWILPENPETTELFHWLVQEVRSFGGEATLLRVGGIATMSDGAVTAVLNGTRTEEYQTVKQECREVLARLDRGSLDPLRGKLEGLKRELDRIQSIDYFRAPVGAGVRAFWETTAKRLRKAEARPAPAATHGRRRTALPPPGSTWVTRPRPHIDRLASAWLIKRFLDPRAMLRFADRADAAKKGGSAFMEKIVYSRRSASALARRTGRSGRSPRSCTRRTSTDGKVARGEAQGIDLAISGLVAATPDDHELLERGLNVFDGLSTRRSSGRRNRAPSKPKGGLIMRQFAVSMLALLMAVTLGAPVLLAGEAKDQAALAKALADAKVSLEKGLSASESEGKPISAKFEIGDDGKLQLSVYTAKGDKFSEVIVHHTTGKVEKAEPITSGEDIEAAKAQSAAMAKARLTLRDAVTKAVYANRSYRAVSVYPSLKDGNAVAEITLHKGGDWKTVTEKLN
jgi:hypothetical protein